MTELVYRPASPADAEAAADLMTAAYPPEPTDPVVTRFAWEHPNDGWSFGRFIAELSGTPVAFVSWAHASWDQNPERACNVEVWLDQARWDVEVLTSLSGWIELRAAEDGARILSADAGEDEPLLLTALERLGFERDRNERVWDLDLLKHGKRLLAEANAARERASNSSINLLTVMKWSDPDKFRKLFDLTELTVRDIPTTLPVTPRTFENFLERMRSSPDRPLDRFWVACDGDQPVALSHLRFPPVRGLIWTGYTCSHPDYRGRGLARAVKLQSLAQAVELGVPFVRTSNDYENAPMLHINETLGYELRPGYVSYLKRVQT